MMYRRPAVSGTLMLSAATLLGIASGFLFVHGISAAAERSLTAWYHARNK